MATLTVIAAPGVAEPHRFTVEDYHRMIEAGILYEGQPVELINGEIIQMCALGPKHNSTVNRLNVRFTPTLVGRGIVQVQGSVTVSGFSEPEPDVVILRWQDDFYIGPLAGPADILLVMEVAESSLAYDRDVKSLIYAQAGIPEYWLWDLNGGTMIRHRAPSSDGYSEMVVLRGDDNVSPPVFPDVVLRVGEILPEVARSGDSGAGTTAARS